MTKKNKAKPKKRELFLSKKLNAKIPLHNYKDPHRDKSNTLVNKPQEFFNAILYKMNDHAKNSEDCTSVWNIVNALEDNMNLDFHELNEKLKSLDASNLKTTSKKLNSLITSNTLDEWTWMIDPKDTPTKDEDPNINCYVDLRDKDTPNSKVEEQNRNYFDKAVNKIVEEEEHYGMIVKVFICDQCKAGTSYCAEKLNRERKIWRCNICEHVNRAEENRYYLYNKIGAFLGSLMDRSESFNEVTRISNEIALIYHTDAHGLPAYSTHLLEKDTIGEKRIMPTTSIFTRYQRTQKIPKKHFGCKKPTTLDTHYYDDATINVGISCSEIFISDDESYLLFQLYFAGFVNEEIKDLENSFNLMIVPSVPKNKQENFTLDEILAVMYDDVNRLNYEGLRLKNTDTGEMISYRLNLINFSADPKLLDVITANINPEVTKLTNVHDEKQTLIPHPFFMTYNAEVALASAMMDRFCNLNFIRVIESVQSNSFQKIPEADWSILEDFTLPELKDVASLEIQQVRALTNLLIFALVMYNSTFNSTGNNKTILHIQELLETLRNLRTTISDVRMLFKDVNELLFFKKECAEFAVQYNKFLDACPGYGLPSDTKYIVEFADLYFYYGPIECLVPYFEDSQIAIAQIRDSYNFKKCLNVLHSMSKVDIVMRNYFSLYAENFILFGCSHPHGRLEDLLLASMIKDQQISDSNCLLMFRSEDSLDKDEDEFCIQMHMKILGVSRKTVLNMEAFMPAEEE
ncbi:hypothetical protein WICPIJ_007271 [Wickerhamomyces pijperi]|uniref:Uncharacterized protein n=1 Tax=Wickerhamomyces pijperi TaxID=599730 RepID=A0A9P8TJE6_WICPI|nr:hypothetical protein WICPIJ_007271 [Wickerhamomyces pijperi]